MMLSCRDTTRLASESLDHQLTRWQRMQVAMHMMMCGPCRRARRLMQLVRDAFGRLSRDDFEQLSTDQSLAPEVRERIKEALRKETPPNEKDGTSV
jgi:predicted anti-sigma-YlaC factor YlaD